MSEVSTNGNEKAKEELLAGLDATQRAALLHGDKIDALSEEEIRARLVDSDSGDTLDHQDVVAGMAHELSAQLQVISQLSDQREPEGLNIAKVLDSASIDLKKLMAVAVEGRTVDIIGPNADAARRSRIHSEISLPNSKAIEMSVKSVKVRLGRVMLTGMSILLGVFFYCSVKCGAICLQAAGEAQGESEQARLVWLVTMALLVSVVGICNSMLMAVTERFREIGTMKCLGALDQFIVKLFLIESAVLGFLMGTAGGVLGVGIMYVYESMRYTLHLSAVLGPLAYIAFKGMMLGTILSTVAAILPAQQAAKMPAAAALRSTC